MRGTWKYAQAPYAADTTAEGWVKRCVVIFFIFGRIHLCKIKQKYVCASAVAGQGGKSIFCGTAPRVDAAQKFSTGANLCLRKGGSGGKYRGQHAPNERKSPVRENFGVQKKEPNVSYGILERYIKIPAETAPVTLQSIQGTFVFYLTFCFALDNLASEDAGI